MAIITPPVLSRKQQHFVISHMIVRSVRLAYLSEKIIVKYFNSFFFSFNPKAFLMIKTFFLFIQLKSSSVINIIPYANFLPNIHKIVTK